MKLKLISLLLVALCLSTELRVSCLESASHALWGKVKTSIEHSASDSTETVRDYLYLLAEEKVSPKEKLQALLDVSQLYKNNKDVLPMSIPIWADISVNNVSDVSMLEQILAGASDAGGTAAEVQLARLAQEVDRIEVDSVEDQKIKTSMILRILFLLQGRAEFSKKIGDIALRQIAQSSADPPENSGNAIFQVVALYGLERPLGTDDSALLVGSLGNIICISERTDHSDTLPLVETIFPELARRCDAATTIELQKALIKAAVRLKLNEFMLETLRWQLGYAYMLAGDYVKAELALRESAANIQSMKLIGQLQLAECLRRQKKFEESDKLALEIEKEAPTSREKYAFDVAAGAQAIRALNLVEKGKLEAALPLLNSASEIYSRTTGSRSLAYFNLPRYTTTIPDEISVLTAEVGAYRKLGRAAEAERTQRSLDAIQSSNEQEALTEQSASLLNLAQRDIGMGVTLEGAKSYLALCSKLKMSSAEHVEKVLTYAEILISNNACVPAKLCLTSLGSDNLSSSIKKRITRDLIVVAECQGDLTSAKQLLSELESTTTNSTEEGDSLKTAEFSAHLDVLLGDYEKAEMQSRQIEEKMLSLDDKALDGDNQTSREKFVIEYQTGLLDRARALVQLKSLAPAMILLRSLLVRNVDEQTLVDASALLANCYKEGGHPGLSDSCEQQALIIFDSMYRPNTASYMIADAKFELAKLTAAHGNAVRSRRYRAEAMKVAMKAHLEGTALVKQIVDYK